MPAYALICQEVSISYTTICMRFQVADLHSDVTVCEMLVMRDHGRRDQGLCWRLNWLRFSFFSLYYFPLFLSLLRCFLVINFMTFKM